MLSEASVVEPAPRQRDERASIEIAGANLGVVRLQESGRTARSEERDRGPPHALSSSRKDLARRCQISGIVDFVAVPETNDVHTRVLEHDVEELFLPRMHGDLVLGVGQRGSEPDQCLESDVEVDRHFHIGFGDRAANPGDAGGPITARLLVTPRQAEADTRVLHTTTDCDGTFLTRAHTRSAVQVRATLVVVAGTGARAADAAQRSALRRNVAGA